MWGLEVILDGIECTQSSGAHKKGGHGARCMILPVVAHYQGESTKKCQGLQTAHMMHILPGVAAVALRVHECMGV